MQDHHAPGDHASQVIDAARVAEHAIQHLCRITLTRPNMTPAEVDTVLAIDTARRTLTASANRALSLYQLLDAAHNETAHIATVEREAGVRRPRRSGLRLGRPSAGGPATATYWFGWNLARSSAVTGGRPPGDTHG